MTTAPENESTQVPIKAAPGVHGRRLWSFRPESDREAGDAIASNFLLHWFPAKIYKPSLDWNYSFWLGTISAALLLLVTLSGLPLLLLYVPSVERAYGSVKDIEYVITFGSWLRSVHRLSAHLMVGVVFLHLARVFLTGGYKNGVGRAQNRQWNWVIGVGMFLATLLLSFTGYLLPWDQLAYWAITVGTNIASSIPLVGPTIRELLLGGRTIEQPTLIRFYVLHVIFLPGASPPSSAITCGGSARTAAWPSPIVWQHFPRKHRRLRFRRRPTRCWAWRAARSPGCAPAPLRRRRLRSTPFRT